MSFNVAKSVIDQVASRYDTSITHIEFLLFGGEPLLRFPLVQSIVKYIDSSGNIQSYPDITIHSKDNNLRKYNFDRASRYLMDNQDFVISVDELDSDVGSMIITIRGV